MSSSQNPAAPVQSNSSSAPAESSNTNIPAVEPPSQASQPSQIQGQPQPPPPPINPYNPLKRQLSDNMEALIAQAKASKTAAGSTAAKAAQAETIYEKLERELTCSICCELFKDPVTLLNCLHNFCGSCVVPWAKRNDSCPSCRSPIQGCADAFALKPLIEMLLKERPDLVLSEDDIASYREIYKPGQKVNLTVFDSDAEDEDDNDNADGFVENDPDSDVEFVDQRLWQPCPCCAVGENAHPIYNCPDPIQDGDETDRWQFTFKEHRRCITCARSVPFNMDVDALRPGFCAACVNISCCALFGPCPDELGDTDFLLPLGDTGLYSDRNSVFVNWFQNNTYEQEAFRRWVQSDTNNHTWESLGKEMRDWILRNNNGIIPYGGFGDQRPITADDHVCRQCIAQIWDEHITDFMVSERERLGWTDNRPKCWYGKNCRTQRHSRDHCARLSHVWAEIPEGERRNARPAAPPRANVPVHVGGVRDNMPAESQEPAASQPQLPNRQDAPDDEAAILDLAADVPSQASVARDAGDPGPSN